MNALVYSGPEVLPSSLASSVTTLRTLLVPNYAVQTIASQALSTQPWAATCALLVFPAVARSVVLSPALSTAVQAYVEGGGAVLAFGADVQIQPKPAGTLESRAAALSIADGCSLRFVEKATGRSISVTLRARSGDARPATVELADGTRVGGIVRSGETHIAVSPDTTNTTILAHYSDGGVAALECSIESGKVVVWDPFIESALTEESVASILSDTSSPLSEAEIEVAEDARLDLLTSTLRGLGLQVPARKSTTALRPLPQFLASIPPSTHIVLSILKALSIDLTGSPLGVFADDNDTFHFHAFSELEKVLGHARKASSTRSDPSTWQVKDIIVCMDGHLPSAGETPLFSLQRYFEALVALRPAASRSQSTEPCGMGDALLYGEVVTSTQTMLDRNRHMLTALPAPLLSLASHQLAGRGRGANVWLSPAGCLQFSLLLRAPLATLPPARLVFVQYLVALAVVAACRDRAVLGAHGARVRLKWPNDICAAGGGKLGGVLVHTSIADARTDIVVGCGLNVLNAPPVASLLQLLPAGADARLSMERTMAAIMAKLEPMWETFLASRGSFEPFMDEYLETWLHSDQLVTLTTTTPPQKVRITGITQHGLLRTVPERDGWSGASGPEFIDLQPDGNSFDMLAGLIKMKT